MDWFATQLLHWFDQHGRTNLPWQQDITPYSVWVSEIMLQQTQVATVIPYYEKFMTRFPTIETLAAAGLDEVLHHWTGLGYYARGRNLHKAAQQIETDFGGNFPSTVDDLQTLPGIGRSTAGAIATIAFGIRAPILDGNVKRVVARFHGVAGYPGASAVARELWGRADEHTSSERIADYSQAIMDLGATVCVRSNPGCVSCPLSRRCHAYEHDVVGKFPGKKPKKEKPVHESRFFILHDANGGCLLEQRPPDGVWGGLWTPPERAASSSTEEFLGQVGLTVQQTLSTRIGIRFRHTFTHFHLDIEPVYIQVANPPQVVRDREDIRWYANGANEPLGLSAPAVKLLASLQEFALS